MPKTLLVPVLVLAIGAVCGCGGGGSGKPDGGSGGAKAGSGGSGGSAGSGGAGSGGNADSDAGRDAAPEAAAETRAETGADVPGAPFASCFLGLRMGVGAFQDAARASDDGLYKMRLALEARGMGSVAMRAWMPYAFALVTPTESICVTEPAVSAAMYQVSGNNCEDLFTFTSSSGRRYVIKNPDSSGINEMTYDRVATLTVFEGNTMVAGPIKLATTTCYASAPTNVCSSGRMCASQMPPPP